ncbi:lipid-binding SYLF domain-containing protein [Noviherbaspirillum pedocola]|uniref:Lipid-binding SYLF domain-containing protein n=1 Tax=Noviherbaspirillum pedocola TaxID=2801341 RepID=A0A934W7N5_9BURK|nr:lipid-binding SYLF domain-containing protein [Noviherbaspirillum pedocola]MBK4736585.1 lipid-binding SYLF domain-containing protein [Noviherbaspirillum pedocola]
MATTRTRIKLLTLTSASLLLMSLAAPGMAQNTSPQPAASKAAAGKSYDASDTMEQVREARTVVEKMKADPNVKQLLEQSKGVFLVPTYGRGGWGIGIHGGEGVMLTHSGHKWSNPVFYNMGGVSIGLQGGAEAGSIAMLLMNDKAVSKFMDDNNFSLNANAGLTIVNYTGKAQADVGHGDIIVWADTKGAYANASVGVSDIHRDVSDTKAFYKTDASAKDIVNGKVSSTEADALKQALPTGK